MESSWWSDIWVKRILIRFLTLRRASMYLWLGLIKELRNSCRRALIIELSQHLMIEKRQLWLRIQLLVWLMKWTASLRAVKLSATQAPILSSPLLASGSSPNPRNPITRRRKKDNCRTTCECSIEARTCLMPATTQGRNISRAIRSGEVKANSS